MTLSISATPDRRDWRCAALAHAVASLCCIAISILYAQFSHGVRSASMTWMFLYPLLGGCVMLLPWHRLRGAARARRLFVNLHTAGIAQLTVSAGLQGVLDIAGTDSIYIRWLTLFGWALIAFGWIAFFIRARKRAESQA